ncbi:MAG TPA: hypothetical protein DCM07_20960 [Planctomycetaceae bacterium]|nr:hypothetical protein [Planctomycetaceae bacterium]HBL42907.1 hypothetical protein [Planctomycetaceae bacterium]
MVKWDALWKYTKNREAVILNQFLFCVFYKLFWYRLHGNRRGKVQEIKQLRASFSGDCSAGVTV